MYVLCWENKRSFFLFFFLCHVVLLCIELHQSKVLQNFIHGVSLNVKFIAWNNHYMALNEKGVCVPDEHVAGPDKHVDPGSLLRCLWRHAEIAIQGINSYEVGMQLKLHKAY